MGWEKSSEPMYEDDELDLEDAREGALGMGFIDRSEEALARYRARIAAAGTRIELDPTYSNRTFFFYSASILDFDFESSTGKPNNLFSDVAKSNSFVTAITETLKWDYYKTYSVVQTHTYNITAGTKLTELYESSIPAYLYEDLISSAVGATEYSDASMRTSRGKTVEVHSYDYIYDYEFGGTEVEDGGYAIELPPGAIGIIGQYEAPLGETTAARYSTEHANETVLTNNSSDIGFTYYGDIVDNPSAVDIPVGDESKPGLGIHMNAEEEGFLKSIFGYNEVDNFADSLSYQIDNLTSRLYGMLSVDRTAYTRTKPPSLKEDNLQEFGGAEASFAPGLTASLGTEETYGREL